MPRIPQLYFPEEVLRQVKDNLWSHMALDTRFLFKIPASSEIAVVWTDKLGWDSMQR